MKPVYVVKVKRDEAPNTLKHWGIKGMRWGVRRYQNEDGTLTDAGKKRYDRDTKDMSDKKKAKAEPDVDKWVGEDMRNTKNLADQSRQAVNDAKRQVESSIRNNKVERMDLSKMTDQQMRERINREILERQYNDMFAPRKSTKGREVVKEVLNVGSGVLTTVGSALGIAIAIQTLRRGG